MLKQSEHNKRYATVFWVLSVVCMGVIFYLSSRTADQSSRESGAVLAWLTRLLGDGRLTDFLVRKSAHFLEYTGLCLLLSFACAATWGRRYTAGAALGLLCAGVLLWLWLRYRTKKARQELTLPPNRI